MNEFDWVQLISLLGFLVLAASAYAGFRLNWKTSITYALIWLSAIFVLTLLFNAVM